MCKSVPRVNDRRELNGIFWVAIEAPGATCGTTSVRTQPATSLHSLVTGGRMGQNHECTRRRPRCRYATDRHVYCSRASAAMPVSLGTEGSRWAVGEAG